MNLAKVTLSSLKAFGFYARKTYLFTFSLNASDIYLSSGSPPKIFDKATLDQADA